MGTSDVSRMVKVLASIATLALIVAGCGGAGSKAKAGGEPQRGGTLKYSITNEVPTLDPALIQPSSGAGAMPGYAIFDSLLVINPESGEVEPKLAESMAADKTAKVWTLTLREGVEFSDGTPYDAEAVRYNWDRMKDPKTGSVAADAAAQIDSMKVISPTKLGITLAKPDSAFDRIVAQRLFMVGSPTAMKRLGADFATKPVGAGPFILEKWVRDSTKTFTRNDNYYDAPRPYLDEIVMQITPDTNQSATALKSGQADMALYWDAKITADVKAAGLSATTIQVAGAPSLAMNLTKAPFDDPNIRLAVAQAIDTEQAAEVLGGFVPAPAPFPSEANNYGLTWTQPDADNAQKLFDEYAAEHGGSVKFTIGAFQESGNQREAKYLQSVLNQFDNVDVDVDIKAAATALGDVFSRNYAANTWGSPWFSPADLVRYLKTGAQFNVYGFSDPEVDKAIEQSESSTDPEVQATAYETMVKGMVEGIPMVQYGNREISSVYTDQVHDVEAFDDGLVYLERVWKS